MKRYYLSDKSVPHQETLSLYINTLRLLILLHYLFWVVLFILLISTNSFSLYSIHIFLITTCWILSLTNTSTYFLLTNITITTHLYWSTITPETLLLVGLSTLRFPYNACFESKDSHSEAHGISKKPKTHKHSLS